MLAFDGETLNEAIAEVSRQTGWRFELADPDLGELRVGGYVTAKIGSDPVVVLQSAPRRLITRRNRRRRGCVAGPERSSLDRRHHGHNSVARLAVPLVRLA